LQTNLCFGKTLCDACCCNDSQTISLYTNAESFEDSTFAFTKSLTPTGPDAGYYSDGTNGYEILANGFIVSTTACDRCSCVPATSNLFSVAFGTTLSNICCATGYTESVYGNGNALSDSTRLYGNTGGTGVAIGYYKGITGDGSYVGATGIFIDYKFNCDDIKCSECDEDIFVAIGTGDVCCYGSTGSETSLTKVYYDGDFTSATGFYYDPFWETPVGENLTVKITDGINAYSVDNGVATPIADCTPNDCIDRVYSVVFTLSNYSGEELTISGNGQISIDKNIWLNAIEYSESGEEFETEFNGEYSPSSYGRAYVYIPSTSGGTLTATTIYRGVNISIDDLELDGDYTTPFGLIDGDSNYSVVIKWEA